MIQREESEAIIVAASLLTVLVCLPFPWIRSPALRRAYSLFFGVSIAFYTYGVPTFLRVGYIFTGYVQLRFLPRQTSAWTVPFVALVLLTIRSISQTLNGTAADLSVKTAIMIDFIRLAQVAANMADADAIRRKDDALVTTRERYFAEPLKECPTLLEFCDFFFFCGSQVVGPPVEYRDFVDFINLKGVYGQMKPGSHIGPAMKRFGQTTLMLILTVVLGILVDKKELFRPEFMERSFIGRNLYMYAVLSITISTLMVGFMFAETFMISCGQGYSVNKETKEVNYNSIRAAEVIKFNTSTSVLESTHTWNMRSHHYLKYYVSLRLKDRTLPRNVVQFKPLLMTYIFSAVWHGPDPGYYFFFVNLGLADIFARIFA